MHGGAVRYFHNKCGALSSNRKVDGSRLTGSTPAYQFVIWKQGHW